jgi:GNAT superfamily N-acetyltransferase
MAGSPLPSAAEIEHLEAAAWADLHGHFARDAGDQFAVVQRHGRAAMLASRAADVVAVNRVIGFGFERRLDAGDLAKWRAFYQRQGKARWFVESSPDAAIDPAVLLDAGGVYGGSQVKLVALLEAVADVPSPPLDVVEAVLGDKTTYMDLVGANLGVPERVRPGIVSTMGHPGWHFYFAIAENQPVAGAAMYVEGAGAWFGLAATLPTFRNRGAQTALLLRRLHDARAAGCRWASAETLPETKAPNPSLRNMTRLGFQVLYHRPWYRFQADAPRATE